MTIDSWLSQATSMLSAVGVSSARLDCLILLEDILNTNRTQILAHLEEEITEVDGKKLNDMILKRSQHVPLAYIRGKAEFYGRDFHITDQVLQPRPETEAMIEILKTMTPKTIIDVGTGSGALAITAKLQHPNAHVIAIDIDTNCIQQAKINAQLYGADITFMQGDLLQPLEHTALTSNVVILANLPYVPESFTINQAATHEPKIAIFGGKDGLVLYRTLFDQLNTIQLSDLCTLTESLAFQHEDLATIATQRGFRLTAENGLVQRFNTNS